MVPFECGICAERVELIRPRDVQDDGSEDLFRHRLENILNPRHELVFLTGKIDWQHFDEA